MIRSKYRWEISDPDERATAELSAAFGISRLVAAVLVGRGWTSEDLAGYLAPGEGGLHDPYEMKDMSAAVERIRGAIAAGERIRVYGDYDADGVTSTALMVRLLTELGANFDTYIPHRSKEGYGLNTAAIDKAKEAGVRLLITVDNGISATEQIAYAGELDIDVVVTDHHEPPERLPQAIALVNPKRKDCPYPFKDLCGAGVVFKLAHAMLGRPMPEYADLAAIGTIADLMPLVGENRIIASLGLQRLRSRPSVGIRALARAAGFEPAELSGGRIGFSIAPRLNAGGRLEHADGALKLLVSESEEEAERLAAELDRLNVERQTLVDRTFEEADELWRMQIETDGGARRAIVLAKEGWNAGIAGLVASKLVERYYLPSVVLAIDADTGLCKGSARSIEGFDLYAALTQCADLLEHYGGHRAAAGMTMRTDRVPELAASLDELAGQRVAPEDWLPRKRADLVLSLSEVTLADTEALAAMEPFGNGNPAPKFVLRNATIRDSRTMGKTGNHLRFTAEQAGGAIEVVAFGKGDERERMPAGMRVDLLGELSINEWNGNRKLQLRLQDYRSGQLLFRDRRQERDAGAALEELGRAWPAGLFVACFSAAAYREISGRLLPIGVPVGVFPAADPSEDVETAAAADSGAAGGDWTHLALVGLPEREQEVRLLREWLAPERGLERVTVFADPARRNGGESGPLPFPERHHFAEAYALCKRRKSWLDRPDGLLQETAQATGWPLSTVRMMHEVFLELGFIAADGAARRIVPNPPRSELDRSEKYRKARRQAAERNLAALPAEELRRWMEACHGATTDIAKAGSKSV
ncbi:single-stranded-DNA-specific exonuclease RecJ [Paenibacillaceae bacterium WGS1546]|uniref:single-stranded-DNA-specific exonuclease RecJ n=1 Tax=Cohnella sp. WGS1546 TaxID=3366810 RepID=UPI00372D5BD0